MTQIPDIGPGPLTRRCTHPDFWRYHGERCICPCAFCRAHPDHWADFAHSWIAGARDER